MRALPAINGMDRVFGGITLPIFGGDARDYLDVLDETSGILFGYLYHRSGSIKLARTLLSELYLSMLPRSMSSLWFRRLRTRDLFAEADRMLADYAEHPSDIDKVYLPSLYWMSADEHLSVSSMHDALWSLPARQQRLLTLTMFVGVSAGRIAEIEGATNEAITAETDAARKALLERWQPTESLLTKLQSLVFAPNLSIADERSLRSDIIAKYSAMRMRRYQWVITAGFVTVLANFIVAGVFAFAVVTEPSASLKKSGKQLAAIDAALQLKRMESLDAKHLLTRFYKQTQTVGEQYTVRELNAIGAAVAGEEVRRQREMGGQMKTLLHLLDSSEMISLVLPRPGILLAEVVRAAW